MANQIFVTVYGADRVGIVAEVAATLSKLDVNIEDIKQTLMQGHFVMFMLCDIEKSSYSFKEIKEEITNVSKNMGMEIWVQKREIFDNMHKI
jgi:ACT domain-containing protein